MDKNMDIDRDLLSKRIISTRTLNRYSQMKLSEELGISQTSIASWETMKRIPSLSSLYKVADFFNKPIDYFLFEDFTYDEDKYESYYTKHKEFKKLNVIYLAKYLKNIRTINRYKQSQVAEMIDASKAMISLMESGDKNISLQYLYRYAILFEFKIYKVIEKYSEYGEEIIKNLLGDDYKEGVEIDREKLTELSRLTYEKLEYLQGLLDDMLKEEEKGRE